MRKVLAVVLLMSFILGGIAEAAVFSSYPADGVCTGDYVRYRSKPGTNSKILGRLFEGDEVTVVSEVRVKGQRWYEIYDPNDGDRTVWVAGQYIAPVEY